MILEEFDRTYKEEEKEESREKKIADKYNAVRLNFYLIWLNLIESLILGSLFYRKSIRKFHVNDTRCWNWTRSGYFRWWYCQISKSEEERYFISNLVLFINILLFIGYVALHTSQGTLNLELYCESVPKASENFIKLCDTGYYNKTKFHRSIRHFMVRKLYELEQLEIVYIPF